jgi:ribosome-binding protein aMBF1 (putative translation factor)
MSLVYRTLAITPSTRPDLGVADDPHVSRHAVPSHRDHVNADVTHSPWTYIRQLPIMPPMITQSDILTRFGRRVRALRTARGQSQETFAEACGIDRTYISGIERGRRNVGLKNIDVIANALGVTLSELFEGV